MRITSPRRLDGDVLERDFVLERDVLERDVPERDVLERDVPERDVLERDVPGILWTPSAPPGPAPLILLGHPGGLSAMHPRLLARARHCVAAGWAAATIELPGSGLRPRSAPVEAARADLRRALQAGAPVEEAVVDRLVLPIIEQAVPEWQAALDALLPLPGLGGPVGWSGGVTAIGVRLARVEPRIGAAVLFAGSRVPRAVIEEARQVVVPLLVLLQWDDEGNDRQEALDLFDALGSVQKTLHANTGGHTGVPAFENEDAHRFFARHLT